MRVAFLLNKFPMLSETFILNQVTGLMDRGHHVDVLVRGPEEQPKQHRDVARYGLKAIDLHQDSITAEQRPGLRRRTLRTLLAHSVCRPSWLRASLRLWRSPDSYKTLVQLYPVGEFLRRGGYDIVHAHYVMNGVWAVELRKAGAFDAKIVTTFHDGSDHARRLRQHRRGAYAEVFQHGDLLMAASGYVAEQLIELGAPAAKLRTHRVGIDPRRYRSRREGRGPAGLSILSVARLVGMKGIEFGLRAVGELAREIPGIRYRIAGDGPLRGELEDLVKSLEPAAQVEFLGWCDQQEVARLLESGDVLLSPSVTDSEGAREGIPTVLMEAMAAGLPVVATRYSGIPELIRDGTDGFLIEERDVASMEAVLRRLAHDPEGRVRMGQRGRERVAELHDIEVLNDRLVEHYRGLIETR